MGRSKPEKSARDADPKSPSNSEGFLGAGFSSETLVWGQDPASLEEKMKARRGQGHDISAETLKELTPRPSNMFFPARVSGKSAPLRVDHRPPTARA